jgi:hypothetical protein
MFRGATLRGFIDRASRNRPLWHCDLASGEWSENSPSEIGWDNVVWFGVMLSSSR